MQTQYFAWETFGSFITYSRLGWQDSIWRRYGVLIRWLRNSIERYRSRRRRHVGRVDVHWLKSVGVWQWARPLMMLHWYRWRTRAMMSSLDHRMPHVKLMLYRWRLHWCQYTCQGGFHFQIMDGVI